MPGSVAYNFFTLETENWSASRRVMLYAAGILLIAVSYGNSLSNSFHFDDSHVIENNAYIRSLRNVPRFFADAHTFSSLPSNATYRPLVSLSLAVDFALGHGLKPRQFHITQIALMILLFVLLVALFRTLVADLPAFIAATWFAVHTANTETMNLISARSELLAAIGIVGSMVLFVRSSVARKTQLHLLPTLAGMLAKAPAAVYAPLLLMQQLLFGEAPSLRARVRRAVMVSLPAFAAVSVALLLLSRMNASEWVAGGQAFYVRTQAWIAVHYLRLFFLPVGLSADTDLPLIADWYDTRIVVGVVVMVSVVVAAFRLSRHQSTKPIAFGLFWFVITLLPSSLYPLAEVANEHRIFLPYVGLTLAITCAAEVLLRRLTVTPRAFQAASIALAILVIGANVAGTIARNRTWRTEESLWLDVTQKSPNNGRAQMNYGLTQMQKGELRRASDYFERAAVLTPNYSTLEINRGVVASALGDTAGAERHFKRALELHDDAESRYYYARWLVEHGRAFESMVHLQRATALSGAALNPRRLLMDIYFAAGETRNLQALARETLAIDSSDPSAARFAAAQPPFPREMTSSALFQQGLTATGKGRHLDAAIAYRSALSLNSRSADAWNNLGWELAALGLRPQAAEAYQATLRIDPTYERARNNLALLTQR
jgi:protein O-mannosyl-transferase